MKTKTMSEYTKANKISPQKHEEYFEVLLFLNEMAVGLWTEVRGEDADNYFVYNKKLKKVMPIKKSMVSGKTARKLYDKVHETRETTS